MHNSISFHFAKITSLFVSKTEWRKSNNLTPITQPSTQEVSFLVWPVMPGDWRSDLGQLLWRACSRTGDHTDDSYWTWTLQLSGRPPPVCGVLLLFCSQVQLKQRNLWPLDDEQDTLCDLWLLLWCSAVHRCDIYSWYSQSPCTETHQPLRGLGSPPTPSITNLKGPLNTCWLWAESHTHNHLLLLLKMALGSLSVILREERRPLGHSCVCVWVRSGILPHGGRPWSPRLAWRLMPSLEGHEIQRAGGCRTPAPSQRFDKLQTKK